jgi:hypothetical protein
LVGICCYKNKSKNESQENEKTSLSPSKKKNSSDLKEKQKLSNSKFKSDDESLHPYTKVKGFSQDQEAVNQTVNVSGNANQDTTNNDCLIQDTTNQDCLIVPEAP